MEESKKGWKDKYKYNTNFSIIIPMKNAERYIGNALESIKEQDYENYEVLVINDHSEDTSKDTVSEFEKNNEKIKIKNYEVEDGKWGPGAGRNVGLENAKGDYIIFLDADDELLPNALKNIDGAIKNNQKTDTLILGQMSHLISRKKKEDEQANNENQEPDVLLLGHDMHILNQAGKEKNVMKFRPNKLQGTKLFQMGINTGGTIWQGCWKKQLFDDNNIRFDENCIFEDTTARIQLYGRAKKIKVPKVTTHKYYVRPGESITTTQTSKHMKAAIQMARNISKLVDEGKVEPKYKKYIMTRLLTMPGTLAWVAWCMGEYKVNQLKERKTEKSKED